MALIAVGGAAPRVAEVDDEDAERLAGLSFHWLDGYARHSAYVRDVDGKRRNVGVLMHHLIIGRPIGGMVVDHIDGNGLNNRRSNLRICLHRDNLKNMDRRKTTAPFQGVYWHKANGRWTVHLTANGRQMYFGSFDDIRAAVVTRVWAEMKYHGKYSRTISRKIGGDVAKKNLIQLTQEASNEYGRAVDKAMKECKRDSWNNALAHLLNHVNANVKDGEVIDVQSLKDCISGAMIAEDED